MHGGAQNVLSPTELVGQGETVRDVGRGKGLCTVMHGRDEIQEDVFLFLVPTLFFIFPNCLLFTVVA